MAYEVNYDDKRFQEVEKDKNKALRDVESVYSGMANQSDAYYQAQIDATKEWEKKQTQLQNEQTDFAISEIEQQKAQEKKDYLKEQSGAYVDWQKQSDTYGANAEAMAAQGMQNTGYSESSQVNMYVAYQNRVATARESYNLAIQNYNNAITEARLQNNSALAEIAKEALEKQLQLALDGFQYKNQLIIEKSNKKLEIENQYYNRYQDVLAQINQEIALAEQIRQYNESLAMQKAQLAEEQRQYNATLALQKQQLAEEQRQFNATLAFQKSNSSSTKNSSGGSLKSSSSGSSGSSSIKNTSKKSSGSSSTIKKSSSTSGSSGKTSSATMKSILALGQGPISAKNLASQVASGKVKQTTDSKGNTTFKYNSLYKRF